jgi:membrane fusion protein, multidrug efflux system
VQNSTAPDAIDTMGGTAPKAARGLPIKRLVLLGALLAAGFVGYRYVSDYLAVGWYHIATDDAYVRADISNVAAKVGGYIKAFPVADNSVVSADTVIAEIDDGDYQIALEAAQKKAESQRATIERFDAQLVQADATVAQARDQVSATQADSKRAEADFGRYTQLTAQKISTPQRLEQAVADRDRTRATAASASSALVSAKAAKDVLVAQQKEAARLFDELQVQVAKAQRELSFTKVRAGVGGVFGNKSSQVGSLVQPGTRLGALIGEGSLYIEANFKETQLKDIRPGQPATIEVDALGGKVLHGVVDSFAPGSGSVFSVLPPENATGNFTKIVQRVPVRIALPADAKTIELLRPGLSAVVTVDTKFEPSKGPALAAKQTKP